jgi:hypothetical protein
MKDIIEKNRDKRILIAIDSLGKEELLVALGEHFQTLVGGKKKFSPFFRKKFNLICKDSR